MAAVCRVLIPHGVQFVIIGGMAARSHETGNATVDVDIRPSTDAANRPGCAEAPGGLGARLRASGDPDGVAFEPHADMLRQAKVGRNERCSCGSGRKYKHCHGLLGRWGGVLVDDVLLRDCRIGSEQTARYRPTWCVISALDSSQGRQFGHENSARRRACHKEQLVVVLQPEWKGGDPVAVRDVELVPPVGVHDEDVEVAGASGDVGDAEAVG